jgi:hypothetical protein
MKRFFILFFSVLVLNSMNAQIHEFGGFIGGSNYIGDIGPTDFVAPNNLAYGVLYKWNKSPRHSWRFSYIQSQITSLDAKSESTAKKQRDLKFQNDIKEFSAGLEFNFLDFNLHDNQKKITPYIYSGLTYFAYSENFFLGKQLKEDYLNGQFSIPMVFGFKSNFLENFIIGVEVGARYTFTDNLDGTNPKNDNLETLRFGNKESNDWYVFTGATLTYTFGNKPCYCR